MPSNLYGSSVLSSKPGRKTLPYKQPMNGGGGQSWPSSYFRPPSNIDQLGSQAQSQMEAFDRQQDAAVDAYQFQGSPMLGVGQGYAMPGAAERAAQHAARVQQGLNLARALGQDLSYEQARRAAANTGQLEIHNDAMDYRNFQRDRMPVQMRTNAYRGIDGQGGQNADLASNLFGSIDSNNAQQIEGYLGGDLDTPILDRDQATGMMSPSQSGITKGDLMGSRGRFYAEQEAGREAARQQVDASIKDAQNRVIDAEGQMPLYGNPERGVTSFTGRVSPGNERSQSTVSFNPSTNTWTVAGGPEAKARAAQQRADAQETLNRRREEIGAEMGLDGPANSMDGNIYNRRKRSDLLKQRNRAKFLARNPGRKYPGGPASAPEELTEAQQESQALAELMTQDFEKLLGADNANPEEIGEIFVGRLESMRGTLGNKDYNRMLRWGMSRGLVPKDYAKKAEAEAIRRAKNAEADKRAAQPLDYETQLKKYQKDRGSAGSSASPRARAEVDMLLEGAQL